jgi:DNA-binding Lrp family transcriptional regulator
LPKKTKYLLINKKNNNKMKDFDYNLIYIKSENARMSLRELSHRLKKSPQRLKYSISVLEKKDIIKNPYCIFDYSFFGQILFRAYFKGGYIREQEKVKTIKELKENPYIISIYELTGEFDLCVEFASPNPSRFNKELKKIATLIPALNDYKIVLNLVTHIYPKNYLTKSIVMQSQNYERIIGGDREQEEFNENEMAVIKSILLFPLLRYTDLAKKSGLNIKTVKSILTDLKNRRILKDFKYLVDSNNSKIYKNRLFLKLHNLTIESDEAILDYMSKTKEIVQINKTLGDWDIEIDIESVDNTRIRYIIIEIREKFKDLIERFNLIEFYRDYKVSYLPEYLFKDEKNKD